MRQIVLDTETTGLDPLLGHRVVELGCVELLNRKHTGRHLHFYLNPERDVDAGALEVHGLTSEFLADKPRFVAVADRFLDFINGAELIIHNAPFDVAFLDNELRLLDRPRGQITDFCSILDTLVLARKKHPGQKNSLDALCKRYSVDNSDRVLHGALKDAEILADVYLMMTGGQSALSLGFDAAIETVVGSAASDFLQRDRAPLAVPKASAEELRAHDKRLQAIDKTSGGKCLWLKIDAGSA